VNPVASQYRGLFFKELPIFLGALQKLLLASNIVIKGFISGFVIPRNVNRIASGGNQDVDSLFFVALRQADASFRE